ncbi:sphingomyelin phosphodiesterase [Mycena pura]|uniref:Sphingomyelin phosphodiesterase n=1 Tax=Mycena pura TaxID=153505 RepID=A0AAD6V2W4_9AGAR|nr:sphingomyelin phosphodiesterase [Mycena pura]
MKQLFTTYIFPESDLTHILALCWLDSSQPTCSPPWRHSTNAIRATLQATIDCPTCVGLLGQLQALVLSAGNDALITQLTDLCIKLAPNVGADVCAGVVGPTGAGPILAHDLRQINVTGATGQDLCSALLGVCGTKQVTPFTVAFPKPAPKCPKIFKSRGRPPFRVAHLSDVHIDRGYTPGSEANCTKPLCCRDFDGPPTTPPTVPAGPNGNSHCDSPVPLADSMLEAVERLKPVFNIFTGDVVERLVWLINETVASSDLHDFNKEMTRKLSGPVYPSIGNHDTAPVNAFARSTSHTANDSQFVFDIQSADWEHWIQPAAAYEVLHNSGSYSTLVQGTSLRILAINTQYWYKQNFWLYDSDAFQPDPNDVLAFMIEELQRAEDRGERVWIIGHIPPGHSDFAVDQSNYFDQVLQRYKHTVAGLFFGHTHSDQFQIGYSNYSDQTAQTAVAVALIGPALTPNSGNPAVKVYDIDPDTYEVMDASVYFTNASDSHFQTNPKWSLLYSARETYGPLVGLACDEPLSPAFWHNLTEVFATNDTAFQLFNTFISRDGAVSPCADPACVNTTICDLRALRSENDVETPGLPLRRRDAASGAALASHASACEGVGLADIFAEMVHASDRGVEY